MRPTPMGLSSPWPFSIFEVSYCVFHWNGTFCGWLINGHCASDKKSRKSFLAEFTPFRGRPSWRRLGVSLQFGILRTTYRIWVLREALHACIVQSWFFCFLLVLPSPFPSRADVKGCEVTARGRHWVGVGRRGGRHAWPSCPCAEFLLQMCCLINTPKVSLGTDLWIKEELQSENMQEWPEKNFLF